MKQAPLLLDMDTFPLFAQLVKESQFRRQPKMVDFSGAYPDYRKSLVSQKKQDPIRAGLTRGVETGSLGAILGALLGRTMANKDNANTATLLGALLGGVGGGIPGYLSGKAEAQSDYSKLLALRRLGISSPMRQSMLEDQPGMVEHMVQKELANE